MERLLESFLQNDVGSILQIVEKRKVKLPKHVGIDAYGGSKQKLHVFLNMALEVSGWRQAQIALPTVLTEYER